MSTHVIVAGHLIVAPDARADYLEGCAGVVRAARAAPGCVDFAIGADLVDPGRINVYERWESRDAVEAFRGSGPDDAQRVAIVDASVAEYDVAGTRAL